MILVKVFGGLAQALGTEEVAVHSTGLTVERLVSILESKRVSGDTLRLSGLLVLVNDVEISVLSGKDTVLKEGDRVAVVPVVHGG